MGRPTQDNTLFYHPLMHIECYKLQLKKAHSRQPNYLGPGPWVQLLVNGFLKGKACAACSQAFLCNLHGQVTNPNGKCDECSIIVSGQGVSAISENNNR